MADDKSSAYLEPISHTLMEQNKAGLLNIYPNLDLDEAKEQQLLYKNQTHANVTVLNLTQTTTQP